MSDDPKDRVIDNVVRMLRVTGPAWTRMYPDDVSLESRVRDIVHEGCRLVHEHPDGPAGSYGYGGIEVRYEPDSETTTVWVTAGHHQTELDEDHEGWIAPGHGAS